MHVEMETYKQIQEKPKQRTFSTIQTTIVFPEGNYPVTVTFEEETWSRPRWPWAKRMRFATITCENPPQFAGKGDNGWDNNDDAIYSMSCQASSIEEAVRAYQQAVYGNRERYGMPKGDMK